MKTYLHLACNTLNLCLLKSHPLRNPQGRSGAIRVTRKRVSCNMRVAKHKMHLDGSLVSFKGQ